jgi:hypothetical protein
MTTASLQAVVAFWAGAARPGGWSHGDQLLHVGIVTHARFRGRGYDKAVVSAMTAHGLAAGGLAQYRTLEANLARSGSPVRSASRPSPRPWRYASPPP